MLHSVFSALRRYLSTGFVLLVSIFWLSAFASVLFVFGLVVTAMVVIACVVSTALRRSKSACFA